MDNILGEGFDRNRGRDCRRDKNFDDSLLFFFLLLVGHSRASTTANIYAHAIPRIDKEASNVFSDILSNGSESGSEDTKLRVIK